jgi:hypothetical protein
MNNPEYRQPVPPLGRTSNRLKFRQYLQFVGTAEVIYQ